ncbi:hypothetical protein BDA96_09G090800 [Sorghum bicolor]|nr:hypothetical protein BDA96_09G090800 [Sorghum bicolor]
MAATSVKVARLTTLALFSPSPTPSGPKSTKRRARAPPPISISMDPALVDPAHLQALMLACAHNCALRLSPALSVSAVEPVDLSKLRTALAHSFIVVSVFCGARFLTDDREGEGEGQRFLGLELGLERQGERRLVGFGRAVSDLGLTASVHDIV